jgi:hypothetical protein
VTGELEPTDPAMRERYSYPGVAERMAAAAQTAISRSMQHS